MTDERLPPDVESYLHQLEEHLAPIGDDERTDILAEVRGHLTDRYRQGRADLLEEFDPPDVYAMRFLDETALTGAVGSGTPWALAPALLKGVRRGGENIVLVLPLLTLQVLSFVLLMLGLVKPFLFESVGLFRSGGSLTFGFVAGSEQSGMDVLGWWTVPLLVGAGSIGVWGCNRALQAIARRRLAAARWATRVGRRS